MAMDMTWEEVKKNYPNQYVLLEELKTHIENNIKIVDDVSIILTIQDPKEATKELVNARPGTMVYHTAKDRIEVLIRKSAGFRGVM